jgi:hypothetical protein
VGLVEEILLIDAFGTIKAYNISTVRDKNER